MSSWRFTVYTIVISLAVGAASGVLGTALTSSYLSDYAVALAELTGPLRRSQERPHPLPASYQEAVERLAESALPSVAEIYQGAPGALGFGEEDRFRIGVVLTGDGWVAVQASSAGPFSLKGANARIRGQMFEIAQSVYDGATRTIFVKVDAAGLPVAAFGKGREMQTGDQAFLAFGPASFASVRLIAHRWPGAALVSSDEPNRFLQVDREAAIGDILFNLNGEVVAIARADGAFLPMEALQPSLRSLLEHQRVTRPTLGVRYLDVAHAVQASDTLTRSLAQGA
ncbi:serine protease, partial [Candidatus Parcubacteria bacterium]|nr:serine protease [Candidatus Parcubacteria bacterium]